MFSFHLSVFQDVCKTTYMTKIEQNGRGGERRGGEERGGGVYSLAGVP